MLIIGLMSGTSADGIDAALVELTERPDLSLADWTLRDFVCLPFSDSLRTAVLEACCPEATLPHIAALNVRLGQALGEAAQAVAESAGIALSDVDVIASHGQTVWHQPTPYPIADRDVTATLQIGEPSVLAAQTGCAVISDFRTGDMALGGQGAPLVPFADYLLFAHPTETRAIQNIGGIANVTYLPAGGALSDVIAFDTGPGNMVLDALTRRITNGLQQCDAGGALAAQGKVIANLLLIAFQHPYFALPPPKSTGREMFGEAWAEHFYREGLRKGHAPLDILRTATLVTEQAIVGAYRGLLPRMPQRVIFGGGGVHNATLMAGLRQALSPVIVQTHADFGVPDEAKEAVAFALLARETLRGRPSNVPSATGARQPAILGKITLPPQGGGNLRLHLDNRTS